MKLNRRTTGVVTRRILRWSHFELIRRSCSTLVADTTPGFRKVDTGQGDSSRGAPPCSIDPFRSTHDERVAYCLPALRRDQPCAAPTLMRARQMRILPSAALRRPAGGI